MAMEPSNIELTHSSPSSDCLRYVNARMTMYLHPKCASSLKVSVDKVLNSLLFKFNSNFDGVLMAYFNPKLLPYAHKILPLYPYFSVRLTVELLMFAPKPDMVIEGKVNKVGKDYIGMLVLGLFNVAIGANDIRQELFYDEVSSEPAWISESQGKQCIKVGTRVAFAVKSVQEEDEFLNIAGSLLPPNTGAMDWLVSKTESAAGNADEKEAKVTADGEQQAEPSSKKHKKKKRKREEPGE